MTDDLAQKQQHIWESQVRKELGPFGGPHEVENN